MNKTITISDIKIGEGQPCAIIAEAAVEHLGNTEIAFSMIDAADDSGADFIKFQMHLPEHEMLPDSIKFWGGSLDEVLEKYNLTIEQHKKLINYCKNKRVKYLCTPFCAKGADVLEELGVDAFKTGSGEMTNIPMLTHMAKKNKPMIVSTGMSTLDEIERTVNAIKKVGAPLILTNCTSIYPAKHEQINLGFIQKLKDKFDLLVGHSDHTPDIWTAIGAAVMGADVIEKHFTLDRRIVGPDYEVSLEPHEFKMMVDAIRKIESAMSSEKIILPEEKKVRDWAHHSVVSIKNIKKGDIINKEMIDVKRPGNGIPASKLEEIVGCKAKNDISINSLLSWEDFDK